MSANLLKSDPYTSRCVERIVMSAVPKKKLTEAEYLAIERAAEFKSEFYDGVMYPMQGPGGPLGMAGAKFDHNRINENLSYELTKHLRGGPCQSLSRDMRVQVSARGLYTYPDVVVVCGELEFLDETRDTLLNPMIIIEVLSSTTERYDRGAKFRHVRLSQDRMEVAHQLRKVPRTKRDGNNRFMPRDQVRPVGRRLATLQLRVAINT